MYTSYAFVAGGKRGVTLLWKNMLSPAVTALATCSSMAAIPVNLEATKKMGIPKDIRETVLPCRSIDAQGWFCDGRYFENHRFIQCI